ncbi:hypothetical protein EK21DRAFT_56800 [Setomelanomma holmii]|uniref:Vacuolar ATPase assembly protein VMA22 n=1 Tax=Setomelanomma holmii TaxID=210430 RepID=A0A9P4LQN9_9PLEO|nr:hypothetical protein EK21DRAFT_56800 [Setomelanomma holmii]
MTDIQSRPTDMSQPVHSSTSAERNTLVARLDELLEKYLHTLDEYQKARQELSKQLSANRSTTHYGQDNYDERMQAVRKVNVRGDAEGTTKVHITFSIAVENVDVDASKESEKDDLECNDTPGESANEKKSEESESKAEASKRAIDPLRWFGILVPPALRSAQSSFITATEGPIPGLASIAREMRSQEIEIGRVRKQIKKL